jgi:hypothetical protein
MLRALFVATLTMMFATTSGAVETLRLFRCDLCTAANSNEPCLDGLSPFAFAHMTTPEQPDRFGISSAAGITVGAGKLKRDGRWVISDWQLRDSKGPILTLVTLHPSHSILVSVSTGNGGHVTYDGTCEQHPVPKN